MKIKGAIGFVGTGNMAEALIRGRIHAGVVAAGQILGCDPRRERCDEL